MHPPYPPATPPPSYRAGFQITKVYAVTLLAAGCALAASWWGLDIARSWGLAAPDGGVLKPLGQRIALGAFVALLGQSFLAGMMVYRGFYIASLDLEDAGQVLHIGRLWPFASLRRAIDEVVFSGWMRGAYTGTALVYSRLASVDAPWVTVRLRGRRWPLLLDLRGRFLVASPDAGVTVAHGGAAGRAP